ncbi:hypothetical protein LTR32_005958 [Rachicladosporium monterosium]|uniref:Uncharacterized protein n=1 Tax=Rachicladosporium monterosium TaxID=1507873 RepID=A0ABR0L0A9_9PEZI|nr:hypothetical protein LTR32_005958 [Rachicladosporium monterosium]
MKAIHSSKSLLSLLALTSFAYANNALDVNTNTQNNKTVQIAITTWGSDFYYSIMSVMGTTAIGILAASAMKPRSDRVFFYMSAALCFVACIAYFAMGSNLGWTPIDVEWVRGTNGVRGANREIFYARYIDWVITTPLLLLDLCLTAGLPWPTILWTIGLDEAMIVTGLIGALVKSRYKWGFYTFGCVAMFGVFYQLAVVGRASAKRLGRDVHRVFLICGVLTLFVWLLYPIAWGLCEGGNVISPNDEAVFYGCLDFMAKPVFSIALIIGHWGIKPERLGLKIEDYTDPEKPVPDQENDLQASPRGNLA